MTDTRQGTRRRRLERSVTRRRQTVATGTVTGYRATGGNRRQAPTAPRSEHPRGGSRPTNATVVAGAETKAVRHRLEASHNDAATEAPTSDSRRLSVVRGQRPQRVSGRSQRRPVTTRQRGPHTWWKRMLDGVADPRTTRHPPRWSAPEGTPKATNTMTNHNDAPAPIPVGIARCARHQRAVHTRWREPSDRVLRTSARTPTESTAQSANA